MIPSQDPASKGKGRAKSPSTDERTPLLASSPSPNDPESSSSTHHARRRNLRSQLTFVFLVSSSFGIILLVAFTLIAYTYVAKASNLLPDDLHRALLFQGPDRVDVLNVTGEGGIWVRVQGKVGLDADALIGVNSDPEDTAWDSISKSIGRWGVKRVDKVTVHLKTIQIFPAADNSSLLASVDAPPMQLSLTTNPPNESLSWLTPMSVPLLIYPTKDAAALAIFMQRSWSDGIVAVRASVGSARVRGGGLGDNDWRSRFSVQRDDIEAAIRIESALYTFMFDPLNLISFFHPVPPLPGLPTPGRNTPFPPFSQLVTLQSFSVFSSANSVSIDARATIIDPAPLSFNFTSPNLPFIVSVPSLSNPSIPIPVVSAHTRPFSLTHPNITVLISGSILPIPSSASSTLSSFLSNYLSATPNPIIISSPILPGLDIDTTFPGPVTKPKVLRNVTIQNMRIRIDPNGGGSFLASGTVWARAVLPRGMDIELDARRVLPDVLVFDGEVPESSITHPSLHSYASPTHPPLPDPLPERAFARIMPDDWLPSSCVPSEGEEGEGSAYIVTANITDVPLEVLPGRNKEFSSFVSKVWCLFFFFFGGGRFVPKCFEG